MTSRDRNNFDTQRVMISDNYEEVFDHSDRCYAYSDEDFKLDRHDGGRWEANRRASDPYLKQTW